MNNGITKRKSKIYSCKYYGMVRWTQRMGVKNEVIWICFWIFQIHSVQQIGSECDCWTKYQLMSAFLQRKNVLDFEIKDGSILCSNGKCGCIWILAVAVSISFTKLTYQSGISSQKMDLWSWSCCSVRKIDSTVGL